MARLGALVREATQWRSCLLVARSQVTTADCSAAPLLLSNILMLAVYHMLPAPTPSPPAPPVPQPPFTPHTQCVIYRLAVQDSQHAWLQIITFS